MVAEEVEERALDVKLEVGNSKEPCVGLVVVGRQAGAKRRVAKLNGDPVDICLPVRQPILG